MLECAPGGTHHAFEPLPTFARKLRRRFPEVCVHEVAVAHTTGPAEFVHVLKLLGYSGLRSRSYDHGEPKTERIRVPCATLDSIIPPTLNVSFIKLDIEGGEYHALLGARRLLQHWGPVLLFEAGLKSTGQYGVRPEQMYGLLCDELRYTISTLRSWLDRGPPLALEPFAHHWNFGPEYMFLATTAP